MNKKIIPGLILVVILLTVLVFAPTLTPYLTQFGLGQNSNIESDSINPDNITQISFQFTDAETITLQKSDQEWTLDGHRVDQASLATLLQELQSITFEPDFVVSNNPENQSSFSVSDDSSTQLIIDQSGNTRIFHLGENTSQPNSYYLRPQDSNQVYAMTGSLYQLSQYTPSLWRDKTIVQIQPTQIAKIIIQTPQKNQEISKAEDGSWDLIVNSNTQKLGANLADDLINTISNLQAQGFMPDEKYNTFINIFPKNTITIKNISDEDILKLEIVQDPDTNTYLARINNEQQIFTLSTSQVNSLIVATP